jgi:hypothetical protein
MDLDKLSEMARDAQDAHRIQAARWEAVQKIRATLNDAEDAYQEATNRLKEAKETLIHFAAEGKMPGAAAASVSYLPAK